MFSGPGAGSIVPSDLARRWPTVPTAAMHPGWVRTEAVQHAMPVFHALTRPILRTPAQGAHTLVCLVARQATPESGRFWFDRQVQPEHLRDATRAPEERREALIEQVFADTDPFVDAR